MRAHLLYICLLFTLSLSYDFEILPPHLTKIPDLPHEEICRKLPQNVVIPPADPDNKVKVLQLDKSELDILTIYVGEDGPHWMAYNPTEEELLIDVVTPHLLQGPLIQPHQPKALIFEYNQDIKVSVRRWGDHEHECDHERKCPYRETTADDETGRLLSNQVHECHEPQEIGLPGHANEFHL